MSLEPNEVDHVQRDTSQTMLYERYGQAIFGYLRLHAHSPEDAEDLLLEVFLAALEHDNLSAFSPREQLAWLRRVAHNKLLNLYRQTSRHPRVALDSLADAMLEEDGPEQQALWQCNSTSSSYATAMGCAVLKLPSSSENARKPCANSSRAASWPCASSTGPTSSTGTAKEKTHAK